MATKLKGLKITSTDLVTAGANPDAHVRLFKRNDGTGVAPETEQSETLLNKCLTAISGVFRNGGDSIAKDARTFSEEQESEQLFEVSREMYDFCYTLSDSLYSIIHDRDQDADAKEQLLLTSIDEFTEAVKNAALSWAKSEKSKNANVSKSMPNTINQKEETDTMKIDKSKMTAAERAVLERFEKSYGIEEPELNQPDGVVSEGIAKNLETAEHGGGLSTGADANDVAHLADDITKSADSAAEMHPVVRKALEDMEALRKSQSAEIEALKKSIEIKDLTLLSKKYEILGKKADVLAPKLYELKKAGGTAFEDYTALLDEQLTLVEKSALFAELGSSMNGSPGLSDELSIKASEIAKSSNDISGAAAIVKAFEANPELAMQYEEEYMKGGRY